MDLSAPANAVIPSLDRDVLLTLARTTRPLSGREVHRLVGARSQSGVQKVLTRLAATGLVTSTSAGTAYLYALNRDHVAADAVFALTDLRGKLYQRIRDEITTWTTPPVTAIVFGSAARGDGTTTSDIDILIVRDDSTDADNTTWTDTVDQLATDITRWSGNPASILDITLSQAHEMHNEPVADAINRDGVLIVGQPLHALRRAAE